MINVILYYNFAKIPDTDKFVRHHRKVCELLGLMGRVYVAQEGINGTLAGEPQDIQSYMKFLQALPGFEETEFKMDETREMPFRRLIVKSRLEIVTLKSDVVIDPSKEKGRHISPQDWKMILDSQEDVTLIDVRNNYESAIGHFEGAICPDVENFYDFPDWLENVRLDKNKKVLMYCTGGIRCEKFSLFMEKKGFKDVLQLHGGVVNYAKTIGDAHYKGKCFVFDDRLTLPVEKDQKEPLSRCALTGELCDSYINCANPDCNKLFICSEKGFKIYQGCCSEMCFQAPRRRPLRSENIYAPSLRWHQYSEKKARPS